MTSSSLLPLQGHPRLTACALRCSLAMLAVGLAFAAEPTVASAGRHGDFTVQLETVMTHDDDKFLWFHPRVAVIPREASEKPEIVMTLQKHLRVSDYYSGLHVMTRAGPDGPWQGPALPPTLDWRKQD